MKHRMPGLAPGMCVFGGARADTMASEEHSSMTAR
jgi:hypothetical protein